MVCLLRCGWRRAGPGTSRPAWSSSGVEFPEERPRGAADQSQPLYLVELGELGDRFERPVGQLVDLGAGRLPPAAGLQILHEWRLDRLAWLLWHGASYLVRARPAWRASAPDEPAVSRAPGGRRGA